MSKDDHFRIIAVCEIIDNPDYRKDNECKQIAVNVEEDIILRYLFTYHDKEVESSTVLSTLCCDFESHYYSIVDKTMGDEDYVSIRFDIL